MSQRALRPRSVAPELIPTGRTPRCDPLWPTKPAMAASYVLIRELTFSMTLRKAKVRVYIQKQIDKNPMLLSSLIGKKAEAKT